MKDCKINQDQLEINSKWVLGSILEGRRKMGKRIWILMGMMVLTVSRSIWAEGEVARFDLGEVVVTATRTEESIAYLASSVNVITGGEIERKGAKTVLEVLRDVPGLDVVQSGGPGGTTSVYLRGANVGHTLVMIDGVDVKDPTQMSGGFFDFAYLTTDNIERIEIIRGPQSTLYGSDAIGGVINIITKKGVGKPKFYALAEAGSYATYHESVGLSGSTQRTNYSFSASRTDSDGFSKVLNGQEDDGYENTTISTRFGFNVLDDSQIDFILRYTDAKTDMDDSSRDDPNYLKKNNSLLLKLQLNQPLTNWWEHKLSLSSYKNERDFEDELEAGDTWDSSSWYDGEKNNIDWQHNFFINPIATLTAGLEWEEDRGETNSLREKVVDNKGYYLQNRFNFLDKLLTTFGIRVDDHETFGSDTNYKLSCAYLIEKTMTKLKANWGTGFKAPSVYQLYSSYGDPALKAEEGEGYDLGIEQDFLGGKASAGLIYFHNSFQNLIEYDSSTSKYKNVGRARTEGMETEVSLNLIENLEMSLNYTYTDTENEKTEKELGRRPENKYNLSLNYQPGDRVRVNLSINYFGSRWNNSANTEKLDCYTKVDLSASYSWKPNFEVFGRVENLFDEDYEEVKGYAVPGISIYTGCKLTF